MTAKKYSIFFAILILCLWLANRCFTGLPEVTVINNSSVKLSNVVIQCNGRPHTFLDIDPGTSVSTIMEARGESGLKIDFDANDVHYSQDDLAYIESHGGYCVTLVINDSMKVDTQENFCFSLKRAI